MNTLHPYKMFRVDRMQYVRMESSGQNECTPSPYIAQGRTFTLHLHTVHVTRNFTKSDEFRGKSARIPCVFRKASARNPRRFRADSAKLPCSYPRNYSTTSAERVSPFRGMILPCPQICPYPVNVFVLHGTCLLCTNMAHKLRTGSYVHLPRVRTLPLRRFHFFFLPEHSKTYINSKQCKQINP